MRDERHEKILDKKRMDERLSKYATSDTHLPPTGSQPEPPEEPQYPLMVVSGLFESERMHLEHVDPRATPEPRPDPSISVLLGRFAIAL